MLKLRDKVPEIVNLFQDLRKQRPVAISYSVRYEFTKAEEVYLIEGRVASIEGKNELLHFWLGKDSWPETVHEKGPGVCQGDFVEFVMDDSDFTNLWCPLDMNVLKLVKEYEVRKSLGQKSSYARS